MLKENKFYNDDYGRKLLYLGKEKPFHIFGDDTQFSKFIYYNKDKTGEFMGILKFPTKKISNKNKKLNISKDYLFCIHMFVYPYKLLSRNHHMLNYKFKKLKEDYDSALEKELVNNSLN